MDTNKYLPKYIRVKKLIEKSAEDGVINPGDKIPTENELREQYNVSRHTVRKALDLLEREGVLEKKQGIGTFYIGNKRFKSGNIGFISISLYDYIFADILSGVDNVLHQNAYQIILGNSQDSLERERTILQQFLEKDVEGLIIEPAKSALAESNLVLIEEFIKKSIPVVVLDSMYDEANLNSVVVDDRKGGFLATNYLIEKGHSRIAMIYKKIHNPALGRLEGYKMAMEEASIILDKDLIKPYINSEFENHDKFEEEIRQIACSLLDMKQPPTAIFCFNDQIAVFIKEIINEQGLSVPEDISLIGFDNSSLVSLNTISIASISHPRKKAGKKAAEIILKELKNGYDNEKVTKIFQPELVERNSVRQR